MNSWNRILFTGKLSQLLNTKQMAACDGSVTSSHPNYEVAEGKKSVTISSTNLKLGLESEINFQANHEP